AQGDVGEVGVARPGLDAHLHPGRELRRGGRPAVAFFLLRHARVTADSTAPPAPARTPRRPAVPPRPPAHRRGTSPPPFGQALRPPPPLDGRARPGPRPPRASRRRGGQGWRP